MYGSGKVTVIIETALGSCSAEWWHIAEQLSERYRVLVYDRPGYGKSSPSNRSRTPENVAKDLHELLSQLNLEENMILIGHSQGGLYLQQYVRNFGEHVLGMILIDPLTTEDHRFKDELSEKVYKGSGVNKFSGLKMGYYLSLLKVSPLLKSLLLKSPPFYYYDNFSDEAKSYMLESLTNTRHYKTAMEEYDLSHQEENIAHLRKSNQFSNIPLHIIYHTPEVMIQEIMEYGGLHREDATKVENLWEEIIRGCLLLSSNSKFIKSTHSSHFVHLTEFDLIEKSLQEIESAISYLY